MAREYIAMHRYRSDKGLVQMKRDMEQVACCLRAKRMIVSFRWCDKDVASKAGAASLSLTLNTKARHEVSVVASLLPDSRMSPSVAVSERRFFYRMIVNQKDSFADIERILQGIIYPYYKGFKAEDLAEEILTANLGGIIREFKRGTRQEDNRGVDFKVTGSWQGKIFNFVFDLKSGRNGQEEAKKLYGHTPTILMRLGDLEKRPSKFIKKVEKLALMVFQKDVLGIKFDRYAFHI